TSTPVAQVVGQVRGMLMAGFNSGNTIGLMSSTITDIPSAQFALAFADNNGANNQFAPFDNAGNPFEGTPVSLTSILIKFTWQDDLNMDGTVDNTDAGNFSNSYDNGATSGHTFVEGDLNYDGVIDNTDAGIFSNSYNVNPPLATLPEPSSFLLAGLGLLGLLFARRRGKIAR